MTLHSFKHLVVHHMNVSHQKFQKAQPNTRISQIYTTNLKTIQTIKHKISNTKTELIDKILSQKNPSCKVT